MRKPVRLTLLAALLFLTLSGASSAQEKLPVGVLSSGISVFAASDDEAGLEVWRSDGTSRGTFRLTDDACQEYCEQFDYFFAPWVVAGNRAFIYAQEGDVSTLWVTDGSREGTFPVYEGVRIWNLHTPVWVRSQRLLFFVVGGNSRDFELWRSDGTPEGTRKVKTFTSIDTRAGIRELTAFAGRVFFNGQDLVNGPALWSSDGTEAGTVLVRRFFRDFEDQGPTWLRVVGPRLLFIAPTPDSGTVLWASDGSRAGTRPVQLLASGQSTYESIHSMQVVGKVLFVSTQQQLWVSDGTRPGTRGLGAFPRPPYLSMESLFKGRYYFLVRTDASGIELWSTNGTAAGTRRLAAVCPHDCYAVVPESLEVAGDRLLFTTNFKIWQTDGTVKGTRRFPGRHQVLRSGELHRANGRLLVSAHTQNAPVVPPQLWRIDGLKKGVVRLTDFAEDGVTEELLWEIPGALLFRVGNEAGRDELWISDGTRPGTRLLKVIRAGVGFVLTTGRLLISGEGWCPGPESNQ